MSTAASGAAPATPAVPKPRPYRRYLTSALHTRFVHSVLLALLQSFLIAFSTGNDYFWSWFPFGPAGLKAVLFTMASLFVFVLQIATMDVGRRTSISPLTAFRTMLFNTSTYQTIFWYLVSAWWFCEAYIWAVPASYNMGWVRRGELSSPDRLNERPIYLRFFLSTIAIVQSGIHLYFGQSFLHVPIAGPPTSQNADQGTHPIEPIQRQLQRKLSMIGMRSLLASALATIIAPFIYKAFFRELFWRIHLAFAKPFFNLSRSDARPPQTYFIGAILGWAFIVGVILSLTWEMAAYSFLVYLKQAPLKNGLPLSANSKDPNGSLLNGLMAKRNVVKTFAFWEFALIAQKYPDRRTAIFADFERPSGPMWTAMLKAALSVISSIDDRILALNPSGPPSQPKQPQEIKMLPRISKDANKQPVLASASPASSKTQKVVTFLLEFNAQALGQPKNPWSPPIKETQQKLLEYTKPLGTNGSQSSITNTIRASSVGGVISQKPAQKISSTILGNPAGNASIVVDATEAVTKMLVASLNEDNFGKVVQTVPESVKQFSRTIMMIEAYVLANTGGLTVNDSRELEEVIMIVDRLKAGLRELLAAFQVFLNDAGLGIKDLNEARRASEVRPLLPKPQLTQSGQKRPEMEETDQRQPRNLGLRENEHHQDDETDQRAQETAQSLRRIESQPRRQRITNAEGNVFGARDFNSAVNRQSREYKMAR